MYDEYGEPSETLVMDWNEHNDHADDTRPDDDPEPTATDEPATAAAARQFRAVARLTVTASRPRGAYSLALTPPWQAPGPLRSVLYGAPVDEETIASQWAARLCYLDNPRTAFREPEAPRTYRSVELALPTESGHTGKDAYTYPLILRFEDPDAAQALAENLTALAAALRRTAPDPFGGCAECVRAEQGVCWTCAGCDEPA